MALAIRNIPVLTGETAERFIREAEKREKTGKPIRFSKEYISTAERMMERSREFAKKKHGKIIFD
ncbi:MAG: hypothetical protein IJ456_02995 [Bacteroides sp.]|nr:hypothetical protein [Bacteroides sp.]